MTPQKRRTMPASLTFHLAACLYPGGLFGRSARPNWVQANAPTNRPGPADRSLQRLRDVRMETGQWSPVILAGDQIYVDATAGLFDPSLRDAPHQRAYDQLNKQHWRNDAWPGINPVTLMDDHEVADNWEPSLNRARAAALREVMWRGRYHFLDYQRGGIRDEINGYRARRPLWYVDQSTLDGRLLFVGDTRSERTARDPADMLAARIMGEPQRNNLFAALTEWQQKSPDQFKFIATSSILLPRRLSSAEFPNEPAASLRSDAWCGYPGSLCELLAEIADKRIENCVFLSGDEHLGCVAEATVQKLDEAGEPRGKPVTLWSVHAGALYAPFPFANSVAADFPEHDVFEFTVQHPQPQRYRCTVQTWFPGTCDGFVEVSVQANGNGDSQLKVIYRDGHDPARDAVRRHDNLTP